MLAESCSSAINPLPEIAELPRPLRHSLIGTYLTLLPALLLLFLGSCASAPKATTFRAESIPTPPDYSASAFWAALPTKSDPADRTPNGLYDCQRTARADVFYVHPTIYMDTRRGNREWNANLNDQKLNEAVDETAILNQASIFNTAGKVYAPRYRQAHLSVFRQRGTEVAERALDTAYADVLAAFDYYLEHLNENRPIIIAAHSQGTVHAARLLRDRFVGSDLREKLVVAYLIGMPVPPDIFPDIKVCDDPGETGCFVSWRTYRQDYRPGPLDTARSVAVVNPLSWSTEEGRVPASANEGGVLYNFEKVLPELVWAEIRGPRLYTNKPKFFGNIFFTRRNYHIGDMNLFWVNIRKNAEERVAGYFGR